MTLDVQERCSGWVVLSVGLTYNFLLTSLILAIKRLAFNKEPLDTAKKNFTLKDFGAISHVYHYKIL